MPLPEPSVRTVSNTVRTGVRFPRLALVGDAAALEFKAMIAVAFLTEIAGLTTFLLLMDFADRTHWLILVAAVLVYMTIGWWTWGLAAHANRSALRIIRSLDLVHAELQEAGARPSSTTSGQTSRGI